MRPLARRERILTEAVESELILYDQQAKKAHRLNPTAAFLWQHCDGARSRFDLAKLLHQKMGLPEDDGLVSVALEQLQKQGLVEGCPTAEGFSRRDALKRLRSLGIAVAMIPVVATIIAPPPAAAVSRSLFPVSGTQSFFDDPWLNRRRSSGGGKPNGDAGANPQAGWR